MTHCNRREFTFGATAGLFYGGGVAPALSGVPAALVTSFIGDTLGKFASEIGSQALIRTLAPTYSEAAREMKAAGLRPHCDRGWASPRPDCSFPVLTIEGDDCFGVVTNQRAGCSGVCVSLPPETAAWNSCLHPRMGLPGYAASTGQAFTTDHIVRYFTPIIVERRRGGPCSSNAVSVFVTQACIVVEIEPYSDCFARVSFGNPRTGRRFRNNRLPLLASDESLAETWAVV